jgi:hypothetical protein
MAARPKLTIETLTKPGAKLAEVLFAAAAAKRPAEANGKPLDLG